MKVRKNTSGFTLIELMIVMGIVAVMAAIAFPYYTDYIRKSRRVDGENALMEAAQKQEVFYARNARYADAGEEGAANISTDSEGSNGGPFYNIAIVAADGACPAASCYRIRATPTTNRSQDQDRVQGFRLWSTGRREHSLDGTNWNDGWIVQ